MRAVAVSLVLLALAGCKSDTASFDPIADAGSDRFVSVGTQVNLDGRGSSDPDGEILAYAWTLAQAPEGTTAQLVGTDQDIATFTPDVVGIYSFQLRVMDDAGNVSAPDVVDLVVSLPNLPPVAVLTLDGIPQVNSPMILLGVDSYDPEGASPLEYNFSVQVAPAGSAAQLSPPTPEGLATYVPDVPGFYVVGLEVSDGELWSTRADASFVVETGPGNLAPVAVCSAPVTLATVGSLLTFQGRDSYDPEGSALSYAWVFVPPTGSSAALDAANIADPTFVADVAGTYTATLTVNDGSLSSPPCTASIEVSDVVSNTPPVADAGPDQDLSFGDEAQLDGSASYDPDGDPITYRWTFTTLPANSGLVSSDISRRSRVDAHFTPDVAGTYELKLVVDDGTDVGRDYVEIRVIDPANTAPVADAGPDFTGSVGANAALDGTASYDPDGDPLTYRWTLRTSPAGSTLSNSSINNRTTASASFVPDVEGSYTLRLTVDDGQTNDRDDVVVSVGPGTGNNPPVADAGDDTGRCSLEEITLDGSGSSDPDGDTLSYSWSFTSVPSTSGLTDADIANASTASPSFIPDVYGTYTLALSVSDGSSSDVDVMNVVFDYADSTLVLHMDEGSGTTVADAGPSALSGTALLDEWTGGRFFGGLEFDGQRVTVPNDTALDLTSDWTVEMWMRADSTTTRTEAVMMRGQNYSYALWRYNTSTLYFYAQGRRSTIALQATNANLDGDWHHYAITMDASFVVRMYEDGVQLATTTGTEAIRTNTSDLTLGQYPNSPGTYDFHGALDELIFYSRALSASEVAARYAETEQFCTGDSDVDAPVATISAPSNGDTLDQPFVAVEGTASDASAIVSLTVNGVEAEATSANYATWVVYLPLSEGSNTLTVAVEDIAGNSDSNADRIRVTYADTCLDGLELALSFDEDSGGVAADGSANALDATESNVDRTIGVFGNAALFDGSSGGATVPNDPALNPTGDFTLDLWFSRNGAASSYEVMVGKGTSTALSYAAGVYDVYVGCVMLDSSGTITTAQASGFNDGSFHHLACVFDGSTLSVYVDGGLEDSAAVNGTLVTSTADLGLGTVSGLGTTFDGAIDNVRLRQTALSAAEVAALATETEPCAVSGNLALAGSVTASGTSSVNYGPAKIIDGDMSEDDLNDRSYWLLPTNRTGYITLNLGSSAGITRLRWVNTHDGPRFDYATDAYEIAISPTGTFTGEETVVDSGNGALETELRYHQIDLSTPIVGQYVRITVGSFHAQGGGINELEVYGL